MSQTERGGHDVQASTERTVGVTVDPERPEAYLPTPSNSRGPSRVPSSDGREANTNAPTIPSQPRIQPHNNFSAAGARLDATPSLPCSTPNGSSNSWATCMGAVQEHDQRLINGWKEEIDSLLVFAGLFSAVLTAFVIESYQLLSDDPASTSAQILSRIAAQLEASGGQAAGSSATLPAITPFKVTASAVRINTLWFSSLCFSLAAALFGMMVKQWVREYMHLGITSPRESLVLRQYRYDGMLKWGVFDIMATLPVLLQIAVMLFLAGLIDLLWTLHPVVAGIVTGLAAVILVMALGSAFLPVFFPSCPYRSPFALFLVRIFTPLALCCRHWLRFIFIGVPRFLADTGRSDPSRSLSSAARFLWNYSSSVMKHATPTWWARDLHPVRRREQDLEHRALVWVHRHVVDDELLDALMPCAGDLDAAERVRLAFATVAQKSACDVQQLLAYLRRNDDTTSQLAAPTRVLLWDDVHYNEHALLALPKRSYIPQGGKRQVVRHLRFLLQALTSSAHVPSFLHPDHDQGVICRRDVLLLIEALQEKWPDAGDLVNREYCATLLALVVQEQSLRDRLRFKALVIRSLYVFLLKREPELDIEGTHALADFVVQVSASRDHHTDDVLRDSNTREIVICATSIALRGFAKSGCAQNSMQYLRLLHTLEAFVGNAKGWSSRQLCRNLWALAKQDVQLVPLSLVRALQDATRGGHLRVFGDEMDCLHQLAKPHARTDALYTPATTASSLP